MLETQHKSKPNAIPQVWWTAEIFAWWWWWWCLPAVATLAARIIINICSAISMMPDKGDAQAKNLRSFPATCIHPTNNIMITERKWNGWREEGAVDTRLYVPKKRCAFIKEFRLVYFSSLVAYPAGMFMLNSFLFLYVSHSHTHANTQSERASERREVNFDRSIKQ